MEAVLCDAFGPISNLRYTEGLLSPELKSRHILIAVKACGVNFPDVLLVQGKYQMKPSMPFIPGGEVSGVVIAIGTNVHNFKVGDKVISFCGYGGFATQAVVKESSTVHMPDSMDFSTAASILVTYSTSYYALKLRGDLKKGETLLVLGAAGGCGLAAVQLGKAMGAKVVAVASTPEKREVCTKVGGADIVIDYSTIGKDGEIISLRDQIQNVLGGSTVNVVFDPVGDNLTEEAVRCLGVYGRLLVVGFAGGSIPRIPTNILLLRQASLIGVFFGQWAEMNPLEFHELFDELLEYHCQGVISPHISAVYALKDAAQALMALQNRKVQGKVILQMDSQSSAEISKL